MGATVLVDGLHLARELVAVAVGDQLGTQHAKAVPGPPAEGVSSLGLLHWTNLSGVGKSHTGYQSSPAR